MSTTRSSCQDKICSLSVTITNQDKTTAHLCRVFVFDPAFITAEHINLRGIIHSRERMKVNVYFVSVDLTLFTPKLRLRLRVIFDMIKSCINRIEFHIMRSLYSCTPWTCDYQACALKKFCLGSMKNTVDRQRYVHMPFQLIVSIQMWKTCISWTCLWGRSKLSQLKSNFWSLLWGFEILSSFSFAGA